jgi:hypothetical protein
VTELAPRHLLWIAAGFTVWSAAFVILYSLQALGCAYAWPATGLRLGLGAVLAAHLVALGLLMRAAPANGDATVVAVTRWTLAAAILATLFVFAPAIALSPCL